MFWLVLMFVLFHQPVSTSDMALDYKEILFDVFDASLKQTFITINYLFHYFSLAMASVE